MEGPDVKVYVVTTTPDFSDPEAVFAKKKHALRFLADNPQAPITVYKYKVRTKYDPYEPSGGERVVTDPSSY